MHTNHTFLEKDTVTISDFNCEKCNNNNFVFLEIKEKDDEFYSAIYLCATCFGLNIFQYKKKEAYELIKKNNIPFLI